MTIAPPPEYVVVPYEYLEQAYKPDKPRRALFATFVRILALAWQSKYTQTPKMKEEELMEFLKLSRRQYYEQKADMELLGWLRSSHPVPGFVQFTFSRAAMPEDPGQIAVSAENRTEVRKTAPSTVVGGESINLTLNTDSPLPPPQGEASAENRTNELPGVKEIVYHADKLFDGASVSAKDIEDREPLDALAWCAYAYRNRSKLTGPGGLVRKRLLDDETPPEWAKQQWRDELPGNFLEALDLAEYTCEVCQATFKKLADLEAHGATHPKRFACPHCEQAFDQEIDLDAHMGEEHAPTPITADESVTQPIREGSVMTAKQAWESVLGQLQTEMPRASFDTWVRDSQAVRYHGNTLFIGVHNAYARDWLESRLASTVSRLLVGIMNASVDVEFVVAEEIRP